ncbi:MAG: Gfo/Idh/MocA family protein [Phycisphaerae bacterium]
MVKLNPEFGFLRLGGNNMYDQSNPLPVGIVGCGGRGLGLGRELQQIKLGRVVALCDISNQRIDIARRFFPHAQVAADPAQLAASDHVHAIIIATPDDTHVDIALRLRPYHKHLLVEKPLATSIHDCDRLVRGYQNHTQTVQMVGLCMRYNNLTQRIHRLVASGLIGQVLVAHCIDNVSVGGDYYFHRWMSRKKHVVGLLLQKGCHSLDFISWIIGSRAAKVHAFGALNYYGGDEPPDKTCSTCQRFDECTERMERTVRYDYIQEQVRVPDFCAYSREVDVCDNAVVNVLYENGAKLSYTECHFTPDYVREFAFIGTEGRIYARYPHQGVPEIFISFRHRPRKLFHETVEMGLGGHAGGDRAMLAEFVQAINQNRPPLTDLTAGRESAAIAISAEQSIETGQVVNVQNVDGSARTVTAPRGLSRHLSRSQLLGQIPSPALCQP